MRFDRYDKKRSRRKQSTINVSTGARLTINDSKSYATVVSLSAEGDNKLLEQLKTGFKGTIKWNKLELFHWSNI